MNSKTICLLVALLLANVWDYGPIGWAFEPTKPVEVVVHTGAGGGSDLGRHGTSNGDRRAGSLPARYRAPPSRQPTVCARARTRGDCLHRPGTVKVALVLREETVVSPHC